MRVSVGTEQVSVPELLAVRLALARAAVLLPITTLLLTAEQPFTPVAVTEYVPALFTVILGVVAALLHSRPVPAPTVAVSVRLVTAQVRVLEVALMLTMGAVVLLRTVAVVLLMQPLALPTVTV